MCVAATAKRRRQQACNGYRHLSPRDRPRYKVRDVSQQKKRLEQLIARERAMQSRGKR
jgi:hypothetical protein